MCERLRLLHSGSDDVGVSRSARGRLGIPAIEGHSGWVGTAGEVCVCSDDQVHELVEAEARRRATRTETPAAL